MIGLPVGVVMILFDMTFFKSNYGIYHRYTFPISEQDYNFDNWLSATNNQDLFSTKTWLEK